jgi:hypothetical protein
MDTSPEVKSTHVASLLISSLGWIVFAIVLVWFFAFARPGYERAAYEKGSNEQNSNDQAVFESSFGLASQGPELADSVNVRVLRVEPGALKAEEVVYGENNLFNSTGKPYTIVYDNSTLVVRRVVLQPEEIERRIAAAQSAGENPMFIAPYEDVATTIESVAPGMRLEVLALDPRALEGNSFGAHTIAIVIEPVDLSPNS